MKHLITLLSLLIANSAVAGTQINCDYAFMGYPTAKIAVSVFDDGSLSPSALIEMQGKTHKETLTPAAVAAGELVHAWISKERPENAIELIIYQEPRAQGQSVAINHNVPAGQEMWGACKFSPVFSTY
jgi:hypothetical protein